MYGRGGDRMQQKQLEERRRMRSQIHPIWRGVGFGMVILIPFISWFGMDILWQEYLKRGNPIPLDLVIKASDPYLLIKIIGTVVLMFVLYIVFLLITFLFNSIFGAPRYGPTDAPPMVYRGKKAR